MRRATILAGLSVLLASPVLAQVCQDPIVLQSEVGRALTWEEGNQDLTQIRLLCSASIEDFPTELADGCLLGASGGAIECTSVRSRCSVRPANWCPRSRSCYAQGTAANQRETEH